MHTSLVFHLLQIICYCRQIYFYKSADHTTDTTLDIKYVPYISLNIHHIKKIFKIKVVNVNKINVYIVTNCCMIILLSFLLQLLFTFVTYLEIYIPVICLAINSVSFANIK
jgi:hypothetical protein